MQTFKQYLKEKVDKNSPIYKEYLQLKKLSIKSLRDMLGRNHKVVDLKGYDKEGAISQILRDKYGNKKVDKVFNESTDLTEAKESTIDQIKAIIANKQRAKVGGKMIDLQTASIIAQIYDKVNPATKKKMENEKIDKLLKIASMVMKKESADIPEGYNMYAEDSLKEAAYYIDISPWSYANAGKKPRGKGMWAFEYKVPVDSGGMVGLQQDRFFSKAMSTYKDAVKQLTKFLKKEFKAKPKDVKIKLAP